jgi:ribosomal protein S18 acetylase RimI-like enzyme
MTEIRPYRPEDWPALWAVLAPVFRAGETYAVDPEITEEAARRYWTEAPEACFVAIGAEGALLGTYYLKPNQAGPGAHVCNCGYVVGEAARGQGLAEAMCRHSQEEGARRGYRAMQFNMVAASNAGAVRLWQRLGFAIVGTLPEAFRHPREGYVDAYVMMKRLGAAER